MAATTEGVDDPNCSQSRDPKATSRRRLSQLLHSVNRHGDARIPASYIVDRYQLGNSPPAIP